MKRRKNYEYILSIGGILAFVCLLILSQYFSIPVGIIGYIVVTFLACWIEGRVENYQNQFCSHGVYCGREVGEDGE